MTLQETNWKPKVIGCATFEQQLPQACETPRVATLVAKGTAALGHPMPQPSHIPQVLLELLARKSGQVSVIVLNVYSLPRQGERDTFEEIFDDTLPRVKLRQSSVLVLGDFNAAHPSWGYMVENPKNASWLRAFPATN